MEGRKMTGLAGKKSRKKRGREGTSLRPVRRFLKKPGPFDPQEQNPSKKISR